MAKTASYSNTAPTAVEVLGACAVCGDGIAIVSARWENGHMVRCLNCDATYSVGDTENGIADAPVSSSVPGGGGQTSGLPGGPEITQPLVTV